MIRLGLLPSLCIRSLAAAILAGAFLFPTSALSVSCPGSGAKVSVIVNNPTGSTIANVVLSGAMTTGKITCTNQSASYSQTVTLTPGANTFSVPASGGLNTGMWVHHVSVAATGQSQYQKGVVLYAVSSIDDPEVKWTYFPTVVNSNVAGDGGGTCTTNCTFRQAIARAALSATGSTNPILIQVTTSPGAMTSAATLAITNPYLTIDGTNSSGNPWIVGDPLAAAQANQDPFPMTIDLNDTTTLDIQGDHITLKGLAIHNTTASGSPFGPLVDVNGDDFTLDSSQIDGGWTTQACCGAGAQLVAADSALGVTLTNTEATAARGQAIGFDFGSASFHEVLDSWIHNNADDAIIANDTVFVRNTVELSGYRPDNTPITSSAEGIKSTGGEPLGLVQNLIRNNKGNGVEVIVTSNGFLAVGDYICGNGDIGMKLSGSSSSHSTVVGVASAYNNSEGVLLGSSFTGTSTMGFSGSAFTATLGCSFRNQSSVTASAAGNQWRGVHSGSCTPSVDYCGGSPISCTTVEDWQDVSVNLDASTPFVPSNVMLRGQTIRVLGTGFNAIQGNPANPPSPTPGICVEGAGTSSSNCCRSPGKANTCNTGASPPAPIGDAGNCVAVSNYNGVWEPLVVTGNTPHTITAEVPVSVFGCQGDAGEQLRVAKMNLAGTVLSDTDDYCTTAAPK